MQYRVLWTSYAEDKLEQVLRASSEPAILAAAARRAHTLRADLAAIADGFPRPSRQHEWLIGPLPGTDQEDCQDERRGECIRFITKSVRLWSCIRKPFGVLVAGPAEIRDATPAKVREVSLHAGLHRANGEVAIVLAVELAIANVRP
jgi:hypothetical protein